MRSVRKNLRLRLFGSECLAFGSEGGCFILSAAQAGGFLSWRGKEADEIDDATPLVLFTVCWVLGSCAAAGLASRGAMLAGGALAVALLALDAAELSWPLAAACLIAFSVTAGGVCGRMPAKCVFTPALFAAAVRPRLVLSRRISKRK